MDISVVVRAREDGAAVEESLGMASLAGELGYGELWLGEGPTWDAFVLATAVGSVSSTPVLTVGPVPVSVRDPATISRGAFSVAAVTGRQIGVALGTASVRVVEKLHGRSRRQSVTDLRGSARTIRELIDNTPESRWQDNRDAHFLHNLGAPSGPLTVAAFGDRAIQVAADYADRMLLDLVTPERVAILRAKLESASGSRPRPRLAAWLPGAVEPSPDAVREVMASIAGYLTVGGYREMFVDAGFGEAVRQAESGADLNDLIDALPNDAAQAVGLVGDRAEVADRMRAYADAGLDEVAVVPMTAGDPKGERTLLALRSLL